MAECKLVSPSKRVELVNALKGGMPADKVAELIEYLESGDSPIQEVYVAAAEGYVREGDLEVDDNAVISEGSDQGAYVQMWKWIAFSELDTQLLAAHNLFYCDTCDELKPLEEKNEKASDKDESACFDCVPKEEEDEPEDDD